MNENLPLPSAANRSEKVTRLLGRFLSRWGVDASQYHWLLQASLKMDFRSSNPLARQRGGTKSALRTTVALNFLFSGLMSLFFAHMVDTFFFAVIMMGYAMAMLAMMILMEFGLAVISPDDHLILAYRPISSRTFLAVRFSNLMFYVLILTLSLSLAPAFAGLMCKHSCWFFPGIYLPVSIMVGLFVAGAVVAFYGILMRWFNYERFKDVLVYCQIALSFFFFFGYQLVPRLVGKLHDVDIIHVTHGWGVLFPSVWFAGLSELGLGHWSKEALSIGAGSLLLTLVVLPGLFKAFSLNYSENLGRIATASGKTRPAKSDKIRNRNFADKIGQAFFRDPEKRAFFSFVVTMFRRNRHLKLQLYPNFGIVIAMFVLAAMDPKGMSDPFSGHGTASTAVLFTSMAFLFGGIGIANLLPYSDEYAGSWLFQVAPVAQAETILKAVKAATLLFLFLPLLIINQILFSFFWPPLHALELGLYGILLGLITFQIALFQFRGFPFAKKPEKGMQSRQFTLVMMMFGMIGLIFVLPMLLGHSQTVVAITCAILLAVNIVLDRLSNRVFANKGLASE